MSSPKIDINEAKEIALRFLSQYHSIRDMEKVIFANGIWIVTILTSSPRVKKMEVHVDAKTGNIRGWQ